MFSQAHARLHSGEVVQDNPGSVTTWSATPTSEPAPPVFTKAGSILSSSNHRNNGGNILVGHHHRQVFRLGYLIYSYLVLVFTIQLKEYGGWWGECWIVHSVYEQLPRISFWLSSKVKHREPVVDTGSLQGFCVIESDETLGHRPVDNDFERKRGDGFIMVNFCMT